MLNRIFILVAVIWVIILACDKVPAACAPWTGPVIIPQRPQFPPPQPQLPQPLPNNFLQPTLKSVPSAPPVVTGNNYQAGSASDNPASGPARPEASPTPPPVKKPVTPPPAEKPAPAPEPRPSGSKTPWLLVAGGVVIAFLLGRRSR